MCLYAVPSKSGTFIFRKILNGHSNAEPTLHFYSVPLESPQMGVTEVTFRLFSHSRCELKVTTIRNIEKRCCFLSQSRERGKTLALGSSSCPSNASPQTFITKPMGFRVMARLSGMIPDRTQEPVCTQRQEAEAGWEGSEKTRGGKRWQHLR